jgi:ATP-dependent RNA helicase DDX19/DBP5
MIKGMRELENKNMVVDLQSKKASWNDLKISDEIKFVLEELKMNKPSIIQAHAIPRINDNDSDNFLFQASNGSGKTLAFGIPSIMKVDPSIKGVQVIIVANTRELIRQVQQVISRVCQNTKVTCCVGDTNTPAEAANIVVTVPKWLENRLDGRKPLDLKDLKLVIYDEADEIFQQEGNHESISKLLKFIDAKSIAAQQVLFSATFDPLTMGKIGGFFTSLKMFTLPKEALKLKGVKQYRMRVAEAQKEDFIMDVYREMDVYQTMIFVNKKEDAIKLQKSLKKVGIKADVLIGGLDQKERDIIIDNFRKTTITSLICTNVLARGIDVPEVDLVINYDVPYISAYGFKNPDFANYIHRVGRTGRFGTDGVAVNLVNTDEEVYDDLVD